MPKNRPETPISQDSSFSCEAPPPSELSFIPGSQHPATPEEDLLEPEANKPLQTTPPPSISAFFTSLRNFLESGYDYEQSLVLKHVTPSRLVRFQRWALKRNKRLRYAYDAPSCTLTIRGMITAVHGALNIWLSDIYPDLRGILSPEERSHVVLAASRDVDLRGGSVRQPDAAFLYARVATDGRWRCDPFPGVVFEAAFKQRYQEVVEVAKLWLTKSENKVHVVVVVNIEEGAVATGETGAVLGTAPHPEDQSAGTDEEEDEDAPGGEQVESENSPSPLRLQDFHDTCDTSQWVGSLTATIEIFRLSGNEMVRDGPQYDILPRTSAAEPTLRISDLLRVPADDHRTVPLPLEPYRRALDMAVRDLALARKAAAHRSRKRGRGEEAGINGEDFEEQEQEEGEGRDTKRVRVLRSDARGAGK